MASFLWVKSQEIFLLYFLQEVTKISGAQKNNHLNMSLFILIPLLTGSSCRSNATITSTPPSLHLTPPPPIPYLSAKHNRETLGYSC